MKNSNYIEDLGKIINEVDIVDLSYDFEFGMPAWPTQARYGVTVFESYDYGDESLHSQIIMSEHTGTHIDSPKHFISGGYPIDQMPTKKIMGRGVKIDASNLKAKEVLTLDQVIQFEEEKGEIAKGDIVLIRFGWEDKWALKANAKEFLKDWPGLSKEAALYFKEKEIAAVGCDTMSLDAFEAENSISHEILLGNDVPIIENLCNLSKIPTCSYIIGLPMKFKGGSGSPIRIISLAYDDKDGGKDK